MKKYAIIFFMLVISENILLSQIISPKASFTVNVDYSRFKSTADSTYFEVYYLVYPSNVTLEKTRDTLRGSVILHTLIKNRQLDSSVIQSTVSIPLVVVDTLSLVQGFLGKSIYLLPRGSYELSIYGYDRLNPARKDSILRQFTIETYNESVSVSDIDICSRIVRSEDKKNHFYKNSYEVLPNPSLLLGKTMAPVVLSYAELYNLNPDSTYLYIVGIANGKGQIIKERKNIRRFSGRNVVDVNTLNITSVPTGKYRFMLILADTLGKEITHAEKQIYIHNPHISSSNSNTFSTKSAEFFGLSDEELKDEFHKVQYIASNNDIKAFNKLGTTEARRSFLAEFWTGIENGKFGGRNDITRFEYLERVLTSNKRYQIFGRAGWQTDRGRVLILYGEPDNVERFPLLDDRRPYEIWHYYQIENGIQFVFADRSGYGEYILVHSTKRGELQDEQWEKNLR